jgi:hypothetical protein
MDGLDNFKIFQHCLGLLKLQAELRTPTVSGVEQSASQDPPDSIHELENR